MRCEWLQAGALLLAAAVANAGEAPPVVLDEVLVTGTQPGPALWLVKSGGNELWILGEVWPLPTKLKWRPKELQQKLDGAATLLVDVGIPGGPAPRVEETGAQRRSDQQWARERTLPDGQTLRELLAPELYARFSAERDRYARGEKDADRLTPTHAASLLLNQAARKLGFAQQYHPVARRVLELADKAHVPVTGVQGAQSHLLSRQGGDDGGICTLEIIVDSLENNGARWKAVANAWSTGDIARLKTLEPLSAMNQGYAVSACGGGDTDRTDVRQTSAATARRIDAWIAAAEEALAQNVRTVAVADMFDLLTPHGVLAALRERGYEVVDP